MPRWYCPPPPNGSARWPQLGGDEALATGARDGMALRPSSRSNSKAWSTESWLPERRVPSASSSPATRSPAEMSRLDSAPLMPTERLKSNSPSPSGDAGQAVAERIEAVGLRLQRPARGQRVDLALRFATVSSSFASCVTNAACRRRVPHCRAPCHRHAGVHQHDRAGHGLERRTSRGRRRRGEGHGAASKGNAVQQIHMYSHGYVRSSVQSLRVVRASCRWGANLLDPDAGAGRTAGGIRRRSDPSRPVAR